MDWLDLLAVQGTLKSLIHGRNINLRYTDNTTLMAESKEERKSLLMKVKQESEKAGLKLNTEKRSVFNYYDGEFLAI